MRQGRLFIVVIFFALICLSSEMTVTVQAETENQKTGFQSLLVICPFPDVGKRQVVETAFVNALNKMTGIESTYPFIGTLSKGEEISRDEFIKRINEKRIEALLFIQIKGIASNLDDLGGSPDPFTMSSEEDEPEGGVYVPKGRAAKTRYQVNLVDFKTGKSLWKEVTMVLGDIWLSLNNVSKSMAKKTAKQLKKTGLLASK